MSKGPVKLKKYKIGSDVNYMQKFKAAILTASFASIALSFPVSYFAYFGAGPDTFAVYEPLSSYMFWIPILSLALWFPLRRTTLLFAKYIRGVRGKMLFVSYVTTHLVLYGLLLNAILHYAYKLPQMVDQPSLSFNSPFYPASPWTIISSFGFYPNVSMLIPPSFDFVWSFYSISLALIIGILVVTNLMEVERLGKLFPSASKTRAFVLLPFFGVIMGATCCLSFPLLISLADVFGVIIPNTHAAFLVAYFVLPFTAGIVLKYNMDSTSRTVTDIQKLEKNLVSIVKGNP